MYARRAGCLGRWRKLGYRCPRIRRHDSEVHLLIKLLVALSLLTHTALTGCSYLVASYAKSGREKRVSKSWIYCYVLQISHPLKHSFFKHLGSLEARRWRLQRERSTGTKRGRSYTNWRKEAISFKEYSEQKEWERQKKWRSDRGITSEGKGLRDRFAG